MTYFQVKINGRNLMENYGPLAEGATAWNTAIDVLATAQSAPGTKIELVQVDGPPQREKALAEAVISAGGSYDTIFCYVEAELVNGQYVYTIVEPGDTCRWFLKCDRKAVTTQQHPLLGAVPICQECKDKYERLVRQVQAGV